MRFFARGAAAVAGLWLIALLAGAFGLGRLPAVPFPPLGAIREQPPTSPDGKSTKGGEESPAIAASKAAARSEPARTGLSGDRPARRRSGGAPTTGRGRSRPPRDNARSALPTQTPGSATPVTPATKNTPRSRERAPAYTPSGNEVAAGPTGPGTTDQMPSSAIGWWRKR